MNEALCLDVLYIKKEYTRTDEDLSDRKFI